LRVIAAAERPSWVANESNKTEWRSRAHSLASFVKLNERQAASAED